MVCESIRFLASWIRIFSRDHWALAAVKGCYLNFDRRRVDGHDELYKCCCSIYLIQLDGSGSFLIEPLVDALPDPFEYRSLGLHSSTGFSTAGSSQYISSASISSTCLSLPSSSSTSFSFQPCPENKRRSLPQYLYPKNPTEPTKARLPTRPPIIGAVCGFGWREDGMGWEEEGEEEAEGEEASEEVFGGLR